VGIDVFLSSLDDQHIAAEPVAERAARSEAVRLLTVHRAKGLEWDAVWVVGAEEGLWPDLRARGSLLQAEQLTPEGLSAPARPSDILAEERRLFYVACTRARTYLTIATIDAKAGEGDRPSRFIAELQAAGLVETIACTVRPRFRLSLDGLVGELREVLVNPDSSPALVEAAATRLAALSAVRDADGRARVPLADPAQWWSTRALTEGVAPVRSLEKPVGLSGSGLESVLECPLSWFLEKEAKAETPRPPSTRFGSVVHAVADFIGKEQLPADLDSVDSYIDRVWHELRFEAPWQSQADRAEARTAISRFIEYHLRSDRALVGTELSAGATVTVPAPDGSSLEVILGGSIDRLERDMQGNLVVIDLKNMKYPPSNKEIPEHAQLGVYQLFVREHGVDGDPEGGVGGAGLVQLRAAESSSSNAPKVQMQPPLTSESPTWVEIKLGEAAAVIRSEEFEARRNQHCDRCAYRTACPAQSEGLPVIT
jgi:ATP-dependent exoDNAse (exonuclease V) beta subunit